MMNPKLTEALQTEIGRIADQGISSSNLDRLQKLTAIHASIADAEYKESKKAMIESQGYSQGYDRDSSYGYDREYGNSRTYGRENSRDNMHNSSRDRYYDAKRQYRYSQSADCKRDLMKTLDEYMDDFTRQMEDMLKDAECSDERATIQRYIKKIKEFA